MYQPDNQIRALPWAPQSPEPWPRYSYNIWKETHIKHLIDSKHLIFYARYVDDTLIIYDSTLISLTSIQHYMDTIHGNIKLNPTHETNGKVNFLDLSITRKPTSLE